MNSSYVYAKEFGCLSLKHLSNRYPCANFVLETNQPRIRDAVLREMDRGGQAIIFLQ